MFNNLEKVKDFILIFLLFIWLINPSNKFIMLFFLVLLLVLIYLTKKIYVSLVTIFFLSSFFSVGKTYFVQLLDVKQFPALIDLYPIGLVTQIQISVSDVIFVILVAYSIIMFYKKQIKFKKITFTDISLIVFFIYGIIADIFVSKNLPLSFFLKKDLFEFVFVYFMIKLVVKDQPLLLKMFLATIISLSLFETFVVLQQFVNSSPIGKSLEATFGIESFGGVPDEQTFIFRPVGTFTHTNVLAMFFAVVSPFILFLIKKTGKYFLKIIFFLVIICLVLTLSRIALLATSIGLFLVIIHFKYHKSIIQLLTLKKIVIIAFLCLPLFFYAFPRIMQASNFSEEGGGLNLRIKQANEVVALIVQSPIFGIGTGMSVVGAIEKFPKGVFASFPSEIHIYPLLIAVENGLLYLGLFVVFLYLSFKKLINYKSDLSYISIISLSIIIIIGLFQPFLIRQFLFILFAFDYDKIVLDSYDY